MLANVIVFAYIFLSLALLLAFIRMVRGPSLPDRIVALELIASIVIGLFGLNAMDAGVSAYLDSAIVLALTAFLVAIGFARFIQVRGACDN
ncbi:MAG: multicomponent Na+:H+ antiporter subunit F [Cellvibrionaceae bacterium]